MNNKGISLIVLIITVLVLAIVSTIVIVTLSNSNIISSAREAVFKQKISEIKEQLYVIEKSNNLLGEEFSYEIPEELQDKFYLTEDRKIAYIGDVTEEATWARESGIEVHSKEEKNFKLALAEIKNKVEIEKSKAESERNYTNLVPTYLSNKLKVYDNGDLVYSGNVIADEATWSRELGIPVIDDAGYAMMENLRTLRDLAVTYANTNNSTTTPNLYSLQYIRKDTYNSDVWTLFLGSIDTNFVNYVNSNSNFVFTGKKLVDTVTGKNVDFVHEMATLNGYIVKTQSNSIAFREFGGWAGDMTTLINEVHAYNVNGDKSSDELKEYARTLLASETVSSSFSLEDMLADIDAINIFNLLKENDDLPEVIYEYYYGEEYGKCKKRFTLFGEHLEQLNDLDAPNPYTTVLRAFIGMAKNTEVTYAVEAASCSAMLCDSGVTTTEKACVLAVFRDYIESKIAEENI